MNTSGKRTLIISHGHPDFNKGGAEVAAYNLYNAMKKQGDTPVDGCPIQVLKRALRFCKQQIKRKYLVLWSRYSSAEEIYRLG